MKCTGCGFENRPEARFCGACGARFAIVAECPQCATANPSGYRYCHQCGERLGSPSEAVSDAVAEYGAEGERRQLTVVFADLVGSTSLSSRIDAEDLKEVLNSYYAACTGVIRRFDGHVAMFLGDGVLAYFGYPQAHEDDAVRAVSASLAILDAMAEIDARERARMPILADQPLAVRIGVHTGPVVVGDTGAGATRERTAVGETLNVAARLQSIALPGTVVISEATKRLVRGLFVLEDEGERQLRGIEAPVRVHRVMRPSGVMSRLELTDVAALTPFVGRDEETALLLDRWEHAAEGLGQVVLVTGDPGVGKSRLVQRFRARLAERPHTWLEARGSGYHRNTAFHPIIELIARGIRIEPGDTPRRRTEKLEAELDNARLPREEVFSLFASLLSLPLPERYTQPVQSAEAWRRRTFEALVDWVFALAEIQPVIFVVEDLHWVDPSTLEFLHMLVEQAPTGRLLVVLTVRPEAEPPQTRQAHVTRLRLAPLTRRQTRELVQSVHGGERLQEPVMRELLAKCDGVPLYCEELTKAVLESDQPRGLAIPTSLQDSLMARLDRLGSAKEIAQLASVLGREFSYEMVSALATANAAALSEALAALERAELLYRRGIPPRATYSFKHALIQEIAYESLLRSRRADLHGRVADLLETRFGEHSAGEPEVIAYHYAQARRPELAAAAYLRAGELAKQRTANVEAIGHLRAALDQLANAPESEARNRTELRVRVALGAPLIATLGYAHEDVRQDFERAVVLSEQVGDASESFEAVYGHSTYCLNRTEMDRARQLSERLLELGRRIDPPSRLPWAHQQMGCVYYFGGQPAPARVQFDLAVSSFDADPQGHLLHVFGQDPVTASMAMGAMTRWLLGNPKEAIARSRAAIARGREVGHPFSLAFALCFCAYNHVQRRERDCALEVAREAAALASDQDLRQWVISARILDGWARRDPVEGIAQIESGLLEGQSLGSRIGVAFQLAMLAERQIDAGRLDAAAATIEFALRVAEETQNYVWDAELHRLLGDVELQRGRANSAEAERHYRRAIDVARGQAARSLELRASVSLAVLAAARGEQEIVNGLLAPLCRSSSDDGDDWPDYRVAADLLGGVNRPH